MTARANPPAPVLYVLVVDPYPDVAASTAEMLRGHGYRAEGVTTGRAVLDLAAADPPDVVLLELALPDMDGRDLARGLRARPAGPGRGWPRRPLLVTVTSNGTVAGAPGWKSAGVDLHLTKPVDPPVLLGILQRFQLLLSEPERDPASAPLVFPAPAAHGLKWHALTGP